MNVIVDYIVELLDRGLEYRTINVVRSAISAYHDLVDGQEVGKHPLVKKAMRAVSNRKPVVSSFFDVTWDIDIVLDFLRPQVLENLSLKDLTIRTVMLLAMVTISRASELVKMKINQCSEPGEKMSFFIKSRKNSSNRKPTAPLQFFRFSECPSLCPVESVVAYRNRTSSLREDGEDQLFISYIKPHKAVTTVTIGRWIKQVLSLVGIDTSKFTGHSTRSASSSKARTKGATVNQIVQTGLWSGRSTWQKFYNKDIQVNPKQVFQESLLKKK